MNVYVYVYEVYIFMNYNKRLQPCSHHLSEDIKHFHCLQKGPLCLFLGNPYPWHQTATYLN